MNSVYPAMKGYWVHHTTEQEYHYLSIGSDSRGNIEYFEARKFDHDTKERSWFIKKNNLVFGRITGKEERFHIDSLPKTSNRFFIMGYDTVRPQDHYMFLDGGLYVDKY